MSILEQAVCNIAALLTPLDAAAAAAVGKAVKMDAPECARAHCTLRDAGALLPAGDVARMARLLDSDRDDGWAADATLAERVVALVLLRELARHVQSRAA